MGQMGLGEAGGGQAIGYEWTKHEAAGETWDVEREQREERGRGEGEGEGARGQAQQA
jgi:hypothetical protein